MEALQAIARHALAGDAQACFELGASFDMGWDVACDQGRALKWFARAARLGHGPARAVLLQALLARGLPSGESGIVGAPGLVGLGPNWDVTDSFDTQDILSVRLAAEKSRSLPSGSTSVHAEIMRILLSGVRVDEMHHLAPFLCAMVTTGEPSNATAMRVAGCGILDLRVSRDAHRAMCQAASNELYAPRILSRLAIHAQASRINDGVPVEVCFRDVHGADQRVVARMALPSWEEVRENKIRVQDRRYKTGYRLEDGPPSSETHDCLPMYESQNGERLVRLLTVVRDSGGCLEAAVPGRFRRRVGVPFVRYRSLRCGYPDPGTVLDDSALETLHSWVQYLFPVPLYVEILRRAVPNASWLNLFGLPDGFAWRARLDAALLETDPGPADVPDSGVGRRSLGRRMAFIALIVAVTILGPALGLAGVKLFMMLDQRQHARANQGSVGHSSQGSPREGSSRQTIESPAWQHDFVDAVRIGERSQLGASRLRELLETNGWKAENWIGSVEAVDTVPVLAANPPMMAVELRIRIAQDVVLEHGARVDPEDLISAGGSLGSSIMQLRVGDPVRFSGTFMRTQSTALGMGAERYFPLRLKGYNIVFAIKRMQRIDPDSFEGSGR